jgi:hypothetical protein
VEQFLTTYCAARNRPRVVKERGRILRKHFVSEFRLTPIAEITDAELGEILDELLDTPSEANHAFKEARTFFRWAKKPPRTGARCGRQPAPLAAERQSRG